MQPVCFRSLVPMREDVVLSDDEDSGVGKVLGPMLDYTRYYPTTLPMHQPRQDDSAASETSEEVRQAAPLFFSVSYPGR